MKRFKVYATPLFLRDLERIFDFISINSPRNAVSVIDNMEKAVMGLDKVPKSYPKAYESASFGNLDLRQLICKNHRIIFLIQGNNVYVLTVLNCRQNLISDEALEEILMSDRSPSRTSESPR